MMYMMNTKLSDSLVQSHTEQPSLARLKRWPAACRPALASASSAKASRRDRHDSKRAQHASSSSSSTLRRTRIHRRRRTNDCHNKQHKAPSDSNPEEKRSEIFAYCRGAVGAHCGGPCEAILPALLVGVRGGIHVPVAIPPPPAVLNPINADRSSSRHEGGQLPVSINSVTER